MNVEQWSSELRSKRAVKLLRSASYAELERFVPPVHYARSVKVYDGDTLWVAAPLYPGVTVRVCVRMLGYDAPEKRSKNAAEKELAQAARDHLAALVDGALLRVESSGLDKYGRLLGTLYIERYAFEREGEPAPPLEHSLNSEMLAQRYGVAYDGGTKFKKLDWTHYHATGELRARSGAAGAARKALKARSLSGAQELGPRKRRSRLRLLFSSKKKKNYLFVRKKCTF